MAGELPFARQAWASRVAVPAAAAIPIAPELGDEVAAQLFTNYVTASMVLRGLRKSVPGEALHESAVLVTGASTAVGRLLLHMLDEDGSKPLGLTRSTASARRVATDLGFQKAATEDADWRAQVTSPAAGQKIVGVLDCVSGSLVRDFVPLLASGAAIVTYGALGGANGLDIGAPEIVGRQLLIRGVTLPGWFSELSPEEQRADLRSASLMPRAITSFGQSVGSAKREGAMKIAARMTDDFPKADLTRVARLMAGLDRTKPGARISLTRLATAMLARR